MLCLNTEQCHLHPPDGRVFLTWIDVAVRFLVPRAPSCTLPCNVIDRCPGSREIVTDTLTSFVEPCVSVRDVSVTSLVDDTLQGYFTISDTLNPSLMVVSGLGVSVSGQPVMSSLAKLTEENGC